MYFLYTGCRETLESTSGMADFCLGTSVDIDIGDVRGYIGLRLRALASQVLQSLHSLMASRGSPKAVA